MNQEVINLTIGALLIGILKIGQGGYVSRSIQIYASSNALFYSEQHIEDVYGVLPEGKFELIGEEKEISKSEFECVIDSTKFTNVGSTI